MRILFIIGLLIFFVGGCQPYLIGGRVFSPAVLSSLILWLDADQITNVTNGGAIASWPDSSGTGHTAVQSVLASRPTLFTGGLGTKPTVVFDNLTSHLTLGLPADFKFGDGVDYSVVILQKSYSAVLSTYGWVISNYKPCGSVPSCRMGFGIITNQTSGEAIYTSRSTYGFAPTGLAPMVGSWHWVILMRSGDNGYGFIDGVLDKSFTGAGGDFSLADPAVTIGWDPGHTLKWTGEIAEVLILRKALSASEISQLADYFHTKYGI